MDKAKPNLDQPELPAPHEKLLRAPTFAEKYGGYKLIIIGFLIVGLIAAGVYLLM
jgi:hypothetical protein